MTITLPAEGRCQCGEIRYRLTGERERLAVCHCTICKRRSGAAFSMSLRMRAADVQLLSGETKRWILLPMTASGRRSAISARPAGSAFGSSSPGQASSTSNPARSTIQRSWLHGMRVSPHARALADDFRAGGQFQHPSRDQDCQRLQLDPVVADFR
jgi:hypothetical protein